MSKKNKTKKNTQDSYLNLNSAKNSTSTSQEELDQQAMFGLLQQLSSNSSFFNNPIWQNQLLKDISTVSRKYTRDEVLNWIENYQNHEKEIQQVVLYLLNTSMHFRRLVDYLATMLTYDYIIVPSDTDLTETEMKSNVYKRSYNKILNWLEKFNVKDELSKVFTYMIEEDVSYFYVRENKDKITFQRLPSEWCKIVNRNEFGFTFSMNFMFFWRLGINLADYPPEFERYIMEIEEGRRTDHTYQYWVTLDPEKAVAFKFNESTGIIKNYFLPLLLDIMEISEYKALIKSRSVLDNFLLLIQKIPMGKEDKKNNFLLELNHVKGFQDSISKSLPQGIKLVSSPMNIESVKLEGVQNKDSIIGQAEQAFYSAGGVSPAIFGSADNKNIGVIQSIKNDEALIIDKVYRQFERWINFQLRMISGKYRFKLKFIDTTKYNQQEKFDMYLKGAQYGICPPQLVAASLGLTPNEFDNLNKIANAYQIIEKMKPLTSSHTASGNSEQGRPNLSNDKLTDSGMDSKNNEDNIN